MPKPGTTWQWQLSGTIDTRVDAQMYDIDLFTTPKAVIDELHAAGRVVICYFSAGSYEPNRPDSAALAQTGLGSALMGWPDERWLDIRSTAVREVMRGRLDIAVKQGCDGVEPDNVDGFDNANGLGLKAEDQVDFNLFLAREAHARRLSIGLKNALALIPRLVGSFDWALTEECVEIGECASLQPFIDAKKAVFDCEYTDGGGTNTETSDEVEPVDGATGTPGDDGGGEDEDEDEEDDDSKDDGDEDEEEDEDDAEDDGDEDEEEDEDEDEEEDEDDEDLESYASNNSVLDPSQICARRPPGFSTIIKHLDLDAYRLTCD